MRFKSCDRFNSVVGFNSPHGFNSAVGFNSPNGFDRSGGFKSPDRFSSAHVGFCSDAGFHSTLVGFSSTSEGFESGQSFFGWLRISVKFLWLA